MNYISWLLWLFRGRLAGTPGPYIILIMLLDQFMDHRRPGLTVLGCVINFSIPDKEPMGWSILTAIRAESLQHACMHDMLTFAWDNEIISCASLCVSAIQNRFEKDKKRKNQSYGNTSNKIVHNKISLCFPILLQLLLIAN